MSTDPPLEDLEAAAAFFEGTGLPWSWSWDPDSETFSAWCIGVELGGAGGRRAAPARRRPARRRRSRR